MLDVYIISIFFAYTIFQNVLYIMSQDSSGNKVTSYRQDDQGSISSSEAGSLFVGCQAYTCLGYHNSYSHVRTEENRKKPESG